MEHPTNDATEYLEVPGDTFVYEISGPLFFGAADKLLQIRFMENQRNLILRMRSVSAIDATAMNRLEQLYAQCQKRQMRLILSHVNAQPMHVLEKDGFAEKIGRENLCAHIEAALERCRE